MTPKKKKIPNKQNLSGENLNLKKKLKKEFKYNARYQNKILNVN